MPRLSKRIRRPTELSRSRKRAWRGSSQSFSRWETKPEIEHEVDRPVAGDLVGDAEVAAARVADRRVPGRRRPRRRQVQARVLAEDAQFELHQRGSRVDTELLDKRPAPALERVQRVGLPAAAIEREHQLAAQALAEQVLADERLELRHQVVMAAERQIGVDSILERGQPELIQPGDLALCEPLAVKIGQRFSAPERKRLAQARRPPDGIVAGPCLGDQRLKAGKVDIARRDVQQIAGRARPDPIGAEQFAQVGDVAMQRGLRGPWRLLSPQRLDQLGARHQLAAAQEQQRQQRPLLGARRRHIGVTFENPQRTKQLKPHVNGFSHALARR